MKQTKHTAAVFLPALMLLVWACGDSGGEPQSAVQGAGALPAQPVASVRTPTAAAEPEADNTPAVMPRPSVSYLGETIPLCMPIGLDREDPCEAEPPPGTRTSSLSMSALLPDVMPTISELIHELTPLSAPHMVVRATGIPGTARCDGLYPILSADFEPEYGGLQSLFHYICFMDFRINEYIIGEGPPELTMDMGGGSVSLLNREDRNTVDEQWMKETFDLPEPEFYSRLYDGKEFIIMVGVSENFAVETWTPQGYEYSMWQITREEDELRAISGVIDLAGTPEQREALNRPLNEVIQEIKKAVEVRTTVNEGRIGPDPNLPELITDANNLQDYYIAVGLVYEGDEATVLPPPVPGAEDLEQDPTHTSEDQRQLNLPTVMPRPPVTYLEEPIPPCAPIGSKGQDPCGSGPMPRTRTSGSSAMVYMPDPLPTISEVVIHELTPLSVPHIVVRATGIPDTTRCDGLYSVGWADFKTVDLSLQNSFRYYCFTDLRVNEYIVGVGPSELTIKAATGTIDFLNPEEWKTADEQWMKETYDFPDIESSSGLEGQEYIIMLGPSINPTVEAWETVGYEYSLWNITREEDGLRAISTAFHLADTPQQSQAMNRPLDEVIQEIKTAVESRIAVNEGRIGPDSSLPLIVTDANRLQDYYIAVGRVYEGEGANTVLPPPVPGAEDLEQDPTRTGENQPRPSTPPVPGEETPSPPPTDDAVTTTTQPVAEETPTTTTQPQAEDTIPAPTETTQPSDDDTPPPTVTETTQSQTGGTIPAPTETTQVPDGDVEIPAGTGEQTAQPE